MNKKNIWIIIIAIVLVGVIVISQGKDDKNLASETEQTDSKNSQTEVEAMMMENGSTEDAMMKDLDDAMMMGIKGMQFSHSGSLVDVSGGNASGIASFTFAENKYNLKATFSNLPEPKSDDFYEGWIVQKSPFKFISTGKVIKDGNGVYTNLYSSGQDLSSYNFYVLTIEPNDGDPAPAGHIVEGTMQATN